jgi:hypothetical protein
VENETKIEINSKKTNMILCTTTIIHHAINQIQFTLTHQQINFRALVRGSKGAYESKKKRPKELNLNGFYCSTNKSRMERE